MACVGTQYGDFEQTLFLGCSIVSFSANAGWNEQGTEVTIELVEDDCPPPTNGFKRYWDLDLVAQQWTTADFGGGVDPGFLGEIVDIVGMPAYFRVKDFEFTGLIQSWERTQNTNGRRYIVKLVSPVSIIENTKLIIGEYAGTVNPSAFTLPFGFTPHNLINIFGFAEAEGVFCPLYSQTSPGFYEEGDLGIDGATFGTPAYGFGGSMLNDNGMPWYVIRNLFNVLVNAFPIVTQFNAQKYSPHGRITGKSADIVALGAPWTSGFGIISFNRAINGRPTADYFVDVSEIPIVPDFFKFNQSEIGLLDAISRVCKEAGHDFYVELLPVVDAGFVHKFIKIRTVSRVSAPAFGVVDTFINNAQASGILTTSSSGREFRNEINSKFVVGGLKQTLYQAYQNFDPESDGSGTNIPPDNAQADDVILPFFGTDASGNMLVPRLDASGFWEVSVPTDNIESSLTYATFSGLPAIINERELRVSASQDLWATHIIDEGTDTNKALDTIKDLVDFPSFEQLFHRQIQYRLDMFNNSGILVEDGESFDAVNRDFNFFTNQAIDITKSIQSEIEEDTRKIYQWVSNFANNYYGTKYAVRVPFSCAYLDPESNQVLISEQPTQDGGWTEQNTIIDLPLNSDELTFFRNDTNKIETIVAFTGFNDLDVSALDPESYVVFNNNLYLRGTVDSEYVYHDAVNYLIPRVIVEIPSQISEANQANEAGIVHGLLKYANMNPNAVNPDVVRQAFENVANKDVADVMLDEAKMPEAAAFGMKSNINTYGPWINIGPVGGIEVQKDDGLVPWEYGGYTNLNLAGNALSQANVTNMQVGEKGTIGIVGYPEIPLGAELNSLTALAGNQLVENRSLSTSNYNGTYASGTTAFSHDFYIFDFGFNQSGVNGPTVTNIAVNVGDQVTTQYELRTYTPKYGRFARLNAERLKEINQNRMKYVRDLRSYVRESAESKNNSSLGFKGAVQSQVNKRRNILDGLSRTLEPGTPHELFVGQMIQWGEGKRTIMSTSTMNELPTEFTDTFVGKSFASFDALFSPIALNGAGGLPGLITPGAEETGTFTGDAPESIQISQVDLNPYVNPRQIDPSGLLNRRYNYPLFGDNHGHGFDLLGRANITGDGLYNEGVPSGGLLMHDASGGHDYQEEYKTIALKGPLLLHSWGYDNSNFPVPNQSDTADTIVDSGVYATTGLTGTFMSGWLTRPDTWPVAPIDLRLNRSRGVWEAGGLATIVCGEATTSSNAKNEDFLIDTVTFFQGSDSTITGADETLTIKNTFGWEVNPTLVVYAMRPAGGGDYSAFQVECP